MAFPVSVLTGSTSFHDSRKVFLVLCDKETEAIWKSPGAQVGFFQRVVWFGNDAEQPITEKNSQQ